MNWLGQMLRDRLPRFTVTKVAMDDDEARVRVEALELRIDGYLIRADQLDGTDSGSGEPDGDE